MLQQQYSGRVLQASKLLMLEWIVPLCVHKRTTDFLLPPIDPHWFDQQGKTWGIWNMSDIEFTVFEQRMLKSYADTLSTVSPAFKDKVFAKVDQLLRMGASSD